MGSIIPYSDQTALLNSLSHLIDSLETQVDTFFVTPYMQYRAQAEIDIETVLGILEPLKDPAYHMNLKRLHELEENLRELEVLSAEIFSKITDEIHEKSKRRKVTNYEISRLYKSIDFVKTLYREYLQENTDALQNSIVEQKNGMEALVNEFIALSIMLVLVAVVVSLFIFRSVYRPIKALKNGTEAFAKGQADVQVEIESNDEVGT